MAVKEREDGASYIIEAAILWEGLGINAPSFEIIN